MKLLDLKRTMSAGLLSFPVTNFDAAGGPIGPAISFAQGLLLPSHYLTEAGQGYAVSVIKAGAWLAGHDAGPVRPPLVDLIPEECVRLDTLIKALGPQ